MRNAQQRQTERQESGLLCRYARPSRGWVTSAVWYHASRHDGDSAYSTWRQTKILPDATVLDWTHGQRYCKQEEEQAQRWAGLRMPPGRVAA